MLASKLSSKGQVTIPKEIRETVGLEPGDMVAYGLHHGAILLQGSQTMARRHRDRGGLNRRTSHIMYRPSQSLYAR